MNPLSSAAQSSVPPNIQEELRDLSTRKKEFKAQRQTLRTHKQQLKKEQGALKAEKQMRLKRRFLQQPQSPREKLDIKECAQFIRLLNAFNPRPADKESQESFQKILNSFENPPKDPPRQSRFFTFSDKYSVKGDRVQQRWTFKETGTPADFPEGFPEDKAQFIAAFEKAEEIASSMLPSDTPAFDRALLKNLVTHSLKPLVQQTLEQ